MTTLAGIQYMGLAGISQSCLDAVLRLVQYHEHIATAKILTCHGNHCLLLCIDEDDWVGVKSGFASGYNGEGPRVFAEVLNLLRVTGIPVEEYEVPASLMERLDSSALTTRDLAKIEATKPVRPQRWRDHIHEYGLYERKSHPWDAFRPVMPWALIDMRIIDLALTFFDDADRSIFTGYRRLEELIRARTKSKLHSTKLFNRAFCGDDSLLTWGDIDPGEHEGRGQLFAAGYKSCRNPRAHRAPETLNRAEDLSEFLLLNHLYLLERTAIPR